MNISFFVFILVAYLSIFITQLRIVSFHRHLTCCQIEFNLGYMQIIRIVEYEARHDRIGHIHIEITGIFIIHEHASGLAVQDRFTNATLEHHRNAITPLARILTNFLILIRTLLKEFRQCSLQFRFHTFNIISIGSLMIHVQINRIVAFYRTRHSAKIVI